MVGCFNITLYTCFDVHRIFDLISFRIWDFILWWFDIDFILFDFTFDFILCVSFLFLFLMHFFLKMMFSFLHNFVMLNSIYRLYTFNFLLLSSTLNFITYLFTLGITFIIQYTEFFLGIILHIFFDFVSYTDISSTYTTYRGTRYFGTHIYILFYFTIMITTVTWFLILRFFFSKSYTILVTSDYQINLKSFDFLMQDTHALLIMTLQNLSNPYFVAIYNFLKILHINVITPFHTISVFYAYKNITFVTYTYLWFTLFLKFSKYLYILNNFYILSFYRTTFSEVNVLFLVTYTLFVTNFFNVIVKDFVYISIVLHVVTIFLLHTLLIYNFIDTELFYFKKQLLFINTL